MRSKLMVPALIAFVAIPAGIYFIAAARYASRCSGSRPSCLDHRNAGCSLNGTYKIETAAHVIDATCDMKTDGGGWTLVLNYLHRSDHKAAKPIVPMIGRLPIQDGNELGTDENGTPAWGHAANSTLSSLTFREMRFFCQTSAHPRTVHFILGSPSCLNYFKTGKGACLGTPELRDELHKNVRALDGHDGHLPLTADKGHQDQGDNALVDFPMFIDWRDNWSIGERWQCDDTQAVDKNNTIHQVWVR